MTTLPLEQQKGGVHSLESLYLQLDAANSMNCPPPEDGLCIRGNCRGPVYHRSIERGPLNGTVLKPSCIVCGATYDKTPGRQLPLLVIKEQGR